MASMGSSDVVIFQPETVSDLYGRVFYGLKYYPSTGMVEIEQIESGEIIKLPTLSPDITYETSDYATWLSSTKYLDFTWESTLSSNLIMEVA